MTTFRDIPFGQPVPNSPHAVLCSLPRLADVIGYEERRPEIVAAMKVGYPRFLTNPLVARAQQQAAVELAVGARVVRLVATEGLAVEMTRFIGEAATGPLLWRGAWAIAIPNTTEPVARAKSFLQHVGASITSRQAEDILIAAGVEQERFAEASFSGDATAKVRTNLAEAFGVPEAADILLTGSGMTAFHAVFSAVRTAQRAKGRKRWLQIGWQYIDTTEILQKFLTPDEKYHLWADEYDNDGLAKYFAQHGAELAGVVVEFPTNPLLHVGDLPRLHALCQKHGVVLIVDPTLASPRVVNVLSHSDVVVNSLTKFAGNEGDVMGGAVVFNPQSPWRKILCDMVTATLAPPYPRDLARLAAQIDGYAPLIERACANAARLVHFLENHPNVRSVHWTGEARAKVNFDRMARKPGLVGSIFSFTLRGDLVKFYDRILVVKGPSFGVNFTLLCPFMYLAHYDLVSTPAGQAQLAAHGLDPALIRVSVGAESYAEIEAAFAAALD